MFVDAGCLIRTKTKTVVLKLNTIKTVIDGVNFHCTIVLIIHYCVFIHFSCFYNEPSTTLKSNIASVEFIPEQSPKGRIEPSYFGVDES